MSNNIEKKPDITKLSHAPPVSSNLAIPPTVVVATPTLDAVESIDIPTDKKDDIKDPKDPKDPKDSEDPKDSKDPNDSKDSKDSKDVLKEIKDAKETKDAKTFKDKKAPGSKEHNLLHRMFHVKEKEKDKDIDEGSGDKSRPGLSKLSPYPSYESDAGSSVSSHTDRAGPRNRPSSPQAHFVLNEDGTHAHYLNQMGKKENHLMQIFHRERKGHHRHLPIFGHDNKHENLPNDKESNATDRVNSKSSKSSALYRTSSELSLTQKYGQCREVCGKGAFGIVRVAHKYQNHQEQLYAVKEFKKRDSESNRVYIKRLTSEFCISSTLHHTNIIRTLDLLPVGDSSEHYAEVMEYCAGGDVFGIVHEFGSLEREEANCFFKQLVNGVGYLHRMGVAHRDLKPENLLLAGDGCLKIADFGNGECFKMAWEPESANVHTSKGICGSGPYIAPEEFTAEEFDPRCVDVWAVGVIYLALITGRHLWNIARPEEDELFRSYVAVRRNMSERSELRRQGKKVPAGKIYSIDVLDKLEEGSRRLIYGMLQPDPNKRLTIPEIQRGEFFQNIWTCHQPVDEDVNRIPAIRSSNGAVAQSKSVGVKA